MATATAPTAVTDPAEQAAAPKPEPTPAAAPGPLARILTPVEPARPHPPLGSTAAMGQQAETVSGKDAKASSDKSAPAKNSDRGSAVAALVHALAARLGRGGTAVKRSHTITETRVSGSTGTHRSSRDAKLADLKNKTHQGRDNHDRKATTDAKTAATRSGRDNRDTKKADTADTKTSAAKNAPAAANPVTKNPSVVSTSMPDARIPRSAATPKSADTKVAGAGGAKGDTAARSTGPARPDSPSLVKPTPAAKADPKGLNAKAKPVIKPAKAQPAAEKGTPAPKPETAPAAAPGPRTRPAREAGYRDGTRAAAVVGQARAYKDGAVDGWDDRTAADKAEGKTMTDTRARNATKPKESPKLPPASGSTVDLAKKAATAPAAAVPAQVTAVGEKAVEFIADGAQHVMSRGEVRTLKAFERRILGKRAVLHRLAERSKTTRAHAADLATRARGLAEDAKSIQGGPLIVGKLLRLAEHAQTLRTRAEEVEKAANRAAESVVVLAANAETRHGGIYRAVVDSPLTAPAEREFYQDNEGG